MKQRRKRRKYYNWEAEIAKGNTDKFYNSTDWDILREKRLKIDKYACQFFLGKWNDGKHFPNKIKIVNADTVHHIIPIKQRPDLAINKFTRLMLDNKEIPMFGDGTTSRDYTYIDDIVDGIIKSCEYTMKNSNVYEILNLGNSSPVSLKEMINTIGNALNITPIINQLPMQPGDVDRTYADVSKARKLIGYEPKVPFEQGIKNFVAWYKENIELYK